jgi:DNA-binding MarR family transcriptional regulator
VGKQLYIDRTTVVQIIDELEGMGLVRRERSATDRRTVTVAATSEGVARLESATEAVTSAEEEFLEPLGESERLVLRSALQRLADHHSSGQSLP